jgi:hypothetical protein
LIAAERRITERKWGIGVDFETEWAVRGGFRNELGVKGEQREKIRASRGSVKTRLPVANYVIDGRTEMGCVMMANRRRK